MLREKLHLEFLVVKAALEIELVRLRIVIMDCDCDLPARLLTINT